MAVSRRVYKLLPSILLQSGLLIDTELKTVRLCGGLEHKELGNPLSKLSSGVREELFQLLFSRARGLSPLYFFPSYCMRVAAATPTGVYQLPLHCCSCSGSAEDPSVWAQCDGR